MQADEVGAREEPAVKVPLDRRLEPIGRDMHVEAVAERAERRGHRHGPRGVTSFGGMSA